jgi:hypothetical protein
MVGVPRPESQEILIRRAYEKAGIDDLSKTGFFECHGTGTQKGDVVETSVIAKVFEKGILMGSVSSFNNCIISLFLIISFPQCTHIVASYRPNQIWGTRRVRQDSPA